MTGMTAERDHQGPDRERMLDVVGSGPPEGTMHAHRGRLALHAQPLSLPRRCPSPSDKGGQQRTTEVIQPASNRASCGP